MGTYGRHTYTITYEVSNMIYNVDDAQVLYWKFVNDSMDPAPKKFTVTVSGPSYYEDTLDVWGYGYEGYAYVYDGVISMSNTEERNFKSSEYSVLLVKYPLNTFNTENYSSEYHTFEEFYNIAEKGTSNNNNNNIFLFICKIIGSILGFIIEVLLPISIYFIIPIIAVGTKNNNNGKYIKKTIKMSEMNNYRDIPCNGNIFDAFLLADIYNLNSKRTDLLGAVLLKWLKEGKIKIIKKQKKTLFSTKEVNAIDLNKETTGYSTLEQSLYKMMYDASKDGILEENELKKWCNNNYSKFFRWFDTVIDTTRQNYVNNGKIVESKEGKILKKRVFTLDDSLNEEAIKLAGLKKFLKEFSRIDERQPLEVEFWQDYLIFAQIFGIAKEVSKQFKKLYPEIYENNNYNIDYMDIVWIDTITSSGISSASSAKSRANSYSSGGGGFSSSGGGGGSFGGGSGGGCR